MKHSVWWECRKLLFQHASFVLTFHFSISIVFCHNSKADGMAIFCVTFAVTRADPLIDCLPGWRQAGRSAAGGVASPSERASEREFRIKEEPKFGPASISQRTNIKMWQKRQWEENKIPSAEGDFPSADNSALIRQQNILRIFNDDYSTYSGP